MRDGRHSGNVQHIQARVAHGFAKKKFGVGPHGRTPAVDVAGFDKGGVDAESAHCVVQQVLRAAIQRRGRHNVRARTHQRGHAQVQRGLTTGGADGADAAFKRCHTLLQHRVGWVADARVDVARALQVEQRGCVFTGLEHKGGGQVDRHGAGAGGRVGRCASVQRQSVKTGVGITRHRISLLRFGWTE